MPTGGSTEAGFGTGIWVSSYADRGRRGFCSPTGVRSTTLRQTLIAGCIVGVLGSELGCSGGKIASPAADSEFSSHAPDAGRQLEDGSSSPQPEEDARVVDGEVAPPPDATQDMDSSVPETGLDPFGVRMLRSTKASGQTWFAAWQGNARTLNPGEYDPIDDTFRMRGGGHTLTIPGDGTAHATGTTQRYYIQDPAGVKRWGDIEFTFYAMRISEQNAPSYAGFTIEIRTDDGHTSDPARTCLGSAYAMAFYYDGRVIFKKELRHPNYSASNPEARPWSGGSVPTNVWIGFKAIVRDLDAGRVQLELYRDLTDGAAGGTWEKVLEYIDDGGWTVGGGGDICGHAADRVLTGSFPIVLVRNDNATLRYKKMSVREVN
jgi:hypothetical protein